MSNSPSMGVPLSKMARFLGFIDLTTDDDELSQGQHTLPPFADLLNSRPLQPKAPFSELVIDLTSPSPPPPPPRKRTSETLPDGPAITPAASRPWSLKLREIDRSRSPPRKRLRLLSSPRPAAATLAFPGLTTPLRSQTSFARLVPAGTTFGDPIVIARPARTLLPVHTEGRQHVLAGNSIDNPITILDDSIPDPIRRDVPAEAVLVLFSDGSLKGNRWGGCGVAYWDGQHWSGKAVALGALQGGSYAAEAGGVVEAFKMAAQLMRPEHTVVEVCLDHEGLVSKFRDINTGHHQRNVEFLKRVYDERQQLMRKGVEVRLRWIKGHAGHVGNEMADMLAGLGSQKSAQGFVEAWHNPNLETVAEGCDRLRLARLRENMGQAQKGIKEKKALKNKNGFKERKSFRLQGERLRERERYLVENPVTRRSKRLALRAQPEVRFQSPPPLKIYD